MRKLLFACVLVWPISAQEFEVASVKPILPGFPRSEGIKVLPGARVVISGLSLKGLIGAAFGLAYWQISGGEAWVEKDAYIIEGVPPEKLRESITDLRHTLFGIEDERLRRMLQSLLVSRFELKFHRETKTGDVYVLQRNGRTLRLRPSEAGDRGAFGSIGYAGGTWTITASTMPQLAKFASDYILRAPVRDGAGLSGSFDYRQSVPDLEPNYTDNSDSFRRLLPELGLKLDRAKGPVEAFVIEAAAKPSPN